MTDYRLELIVLPVADVDLAKEFYVDRLGWRLDVDHRAGEDFRVVQITPTGSACSISLMRNAEAAGSVGGLHLVVRDIDEAHDDLTGRGAVVQGPFHFEEGRQVHGRDPQRADFGSFLAFSDPDGNSWMVQEVSSR